MPFTGRKWSKLNTAMTTTVYSTGPSGSLKHCQCPDQLVRPPLEGLDEAPERPAGQVQLAIMRTHRSDRGTSTSGT